MKKFVCIVAFIICQLTIAQEKGIISGTLLDKEMNNEPLSFASVVVKGTAIGTETDLDGNFTLSVTSGSQTLVFNFLGYKTLEVPVVVISGETITVNSILEAAEGVALEEVTLKASTSKQKESALLLEQRKATTIKESIGVERLRKIGVSNAASATTKISGVSRSEESGDIYIRGLGDRYLSTSMNGLPIPSDDVQNKNIDLSLFSTNLLNSIGISKTYTTSSYADQSSGNVDVISKKYSKKGVTIGINGGLNSAVNSLRDSFKKTVISNDVTFGFHSKKYILSDAITYQGWDPLIANNTANFNGSFSAAYKFKIFDKDFSILATASHGQSFEYQEGLFKSYRANVLDNDFTTESFTTNTNTTGYIRGDVKLNENHKISYNTLFVNKGVDNVFEQGRFGNGYVFDQQPQEDGAFVRDQNYKQTTMFVNQLMGTHKLTERNSLRWAVGYNFVLAEEPNRIRNEGNVIDDNGTFTYAYVGDFQQRKTSQKIQDDEMNGYVENQFSFGDIDEDEKRPFRLNIGANFRHKERTFKSLFVGVSARDFSVVSLDDISTTFTLDNFNTANGQPELILREQFPDAYNAELTVVAGYANLDFGLNKKFSGNIGFRYESDKINIIWDVANFVGRIGTTTKDYNELYPSINLKYEFNEKSFLRLASSITQTLPEFKEIAPFEYVSPTGRVIKGNPNLQKSSVFNIDTKWEFFPTSEELFSATVFYKNIQDPINLTQARGSAGIFQYENTGEMASVVGIELEGRINLIENDDEKSILSTNATITQMWFNQDILELYQYNNITDTNLQGASDFITNVSVSYNSRTAKEFTASISGNYSSDKIYALGSPEDFVNSATLFNDEIIEKGFVSVDLVASKKINEKLSLRIIGKNLLNPKIDQTQVVTVFDANNTIVSKTNETVQSYKRGSLFNIGFSYKF